MITVPVQVQYLVDEVTQIGMLNGKFARFDGNVYQCDISIDEAADKYLAVGVRVPDEFPAVREIINQKIAKLQALL